MGPTKANHLLSRVQGIPLFGESGPEHCLLWQNKVNSSQKGRCASKDNVVTGDGSQDDRGSVLPVQTAAWPTWTILRQQRSGFSVARESSHQDHTHNNILKSLFYVFEDINHTASSISLYFVQVI